MLRAATIVGLVAACSSRDAGTSAEGPISAKPVAGSIHQPARPVDRVHGLVERLGSDNPAVRDAALDELCALARGKQLTADEGIALVRATTRFPAHTEIDTAARILDALSHDPRREYIAPVVALVPRLGHAAQHAALHLLASTDDPEAAAAFVELVRAHADDLEAPSPLVELAHAPHQASAVFPALLALASHPKLADDVYATALAYCDARQLSPGVLAGRTAPLVDAYRVHHDWLVAHQQSGGVAWRWADDYAPHRRSAELLLSVFACLPAGDVDEALTQALALKDPALVSAAALALVDHGRAVPPAAFELVAANADTRAPLYEALAARKHLELFPQAYATRDALAESAMVGWLAYPTELGRAPDAIERVKTVAVDTPEGRADVYLFKFKTVAPHWASKDGWIAGIAGPFSRRDAPAAHAGGAFSDFERWDARDPDDHLALLRARLDRRASLDH